MYYAPGIGIKAQFGPGITGLKAAGLAAKNKLTNFVLGDVVAGDFPGSTVRGPNLLQKAFGAVTGTGGGGKGVGGLGKLATLGLVSKFLTTELGMTEEQAEEELARDPSTYLRQYFTNLNPNASEEEITEFVTTNTSEYAVGGRVGYASGTGYNSRKRYSFLIDKYNKGIPLSPSEADELEMLEMTYADESQTLDMAQGGRIGFAEGPVLPPDPTQPVNPFGPKPGDFGIEEDIPIKMASNIENDKILEALFEKYIDMGLSPKDAAEAAQKEFERMSMMKTEGRGLAAIGGKMDSASDNAMQAAGIEGLPIRQNPKGVKELDLRNTGGFIQPVGIKEKEDDIPAMLSNNEFVFTADAVRGMGDGNVNVGAQRMYDMMKKLEAGGRV